MRMNHSLGLKLLAALLLAALPALAADAHAASPLLTRGVEATLSSQATPSYGLFTCQVGEVPGTSCYDPFQIRHAYNIDTLINAGYDGHGKTIVIVDAFQNPTLLTSLNTFISFYGIAGLNGIGNAADPSLGTFTQVAPDGLTPFDSTDQNMIGWAQEITLDVVWAHAVAPGANIVLVLAKSNSDVDLLSATKYAVDHKLGDIISQSFGGNESCADSKLLKQQHQVFTKATQRGMTIFASSGDEGAAQETCDGNSWTQAVSSPASDPLVTAVGGTILNAAPYCLTVLGCDPTSNPTAGTYQGEVAWNEYDQLATGGGYSVLYHTPLYQLLSVPRKQLFKRGVPDVAYNASVNNGVLTHLDIPGLPAGWYLFGGTSAGSPQWAGIAAIADQKAGRDLGFINAALYLFSWLPQSYAGTFHDVTIGNNAVTELDSDNNPVSVAGFNAGMGWDATTGLGSPKADTIVNYLTKFTLLQDGPNAIQNSDPSGSGSHGPHKLHHH